MCPDFLPILSLVVSAQCFISMLFVLGWFVSMLFLGYSISYFSVGWVRSPVGLNGKPAEICGFPLEHAVRCFGKHLLSSNPTPLKYVDHAARHFIALRERNTK